MAIVILLEDVAATERARGLVSLAQPRYVQGLVGDGGGEVTELAVVEADACVVVVIVDDIAGVEVTDVMAVLVGE